MSGHRTYSERVCVQCSAAYICRSDTKQQTCSVVCGGLIRRRPTGHNEAVCRRCGVTIYAAPSEVALGKGLYCSRSCRFGRVEDRFMAFVSVQPDGCWLWTGRSWTRRNGPEYGGYPLFQWNGRPTLAHRVAWRLFVDADLPDDVLVRHRCPGGGNRWCVNPEHLATGDRLDNMRDMVKDGRHWSQTGLILRLPDELRARLEARAVLESVTLPALIVSLLEDVA
jgi:hypothetical protein